MATGIDSIETVIAILIATADHRDALSLDRIGLRGEGMPQDDHRLRLADRRPRRTSRAAGTIADHANRAGIELRQLRLPIEPPPSCCSPCREHDENHDPPAASRPPPALFGHSAVEYGPGIHTACRADFLAWRNQCPAVRAIALVISHGRRLTNERRPRSASSRSHHGRIVR